MAASIPFLSPAMLNLSRNSSRNKTSTRYKVIIQFRRLSIANEGKSNIDKNLSGSLNFCLFVCLFVFVDEAPNVVFLPLSQSYYYINII